MSGTSGWTLDQLASLRAAAGSGILEVRFADGRTVKYADLSQMMAAISTIEGELRGGGLLAAPSAGPIYTTFDRY